MGCGQSKINLYPRRNKNGGKTNSAKKSGAADKEADDDEGPAAGGGGGGGGADGGEDATDDERGKHLLPLSAHPAPLEISASQQDFFKMLDEKIEKGKDYDSSSETELRLERERKVALIQQWKATSKSTQSSQSQPSPPTPARRRGPAPAPSPSSDARSPATVRRCCRVNGDRDWPPDSPKRTTATTHWRNNPKVAPYASKKKGLDANDNKAETDTGSPPAQPYIAQIVTYPMSQQVTSQTPQYIAPPEQYQDPEETSRLPLYFVPASPHPEQIAQQRHQTAIHLQQYVAMKQAQQHMFSYYQRAPHSVFPDEIASDGSVRPHSAPGRGYIGSVWGSSSYYRGEEFQYCPPQLVLRPGSAGTLPRSTKMDNEVSTNSCQSLNVMRAKPVGQVVCAPELAVVTAQQAPAPDPPDKTARAPNARTLKNSKSLDST